mmetsp:Transcript_31848/g.57967  ORF Transcript_31848/g.57967 Transcript_31848/m.57967 type:complete len:262 (-) Transcript_31848:109-894(-)
MAASSCATVDRNQGCSLFASRRLRRRSAVAKDWPATGSSNSLIWRSICSCGNCCTIFLGDVPAFLPIGLPFGERAGDVSGTTGSGDAGDCVPCVCLWMAKEGGEKDGFAGDTISVSEGSALSWCSFASSSITVGSIWAGDVASSSSGFFALASICAVAGSLVLTCTVAGWTACSACSVASFEVALGMSGTLACIGAAGCVTTLGEPSSGLLASATFISGACALAPKCAASCAGDCQLGGGETTPAVLASGDWHGIGIGIHG